MSAPRVGPEQVGARAAGERGGVLGAEVADPAAERLEFGDPVVDRPLGSVQERGQVRTERLVGAAEVSATVVPTPGKERRS